MKKFIKIIFDFFIIFIFILLIAFIKLKLEGKDVMPYVKKYANVNATNNYGKILLDNLLESVDFSGFKMISSTSSVLSFNDDPVIYIYNTHQREEYESSTVLDASLYLKDLLEKLGYPTIVEERDIVGTVNQMGLSYPHTYTISRNFAVENLSLYPSIKILIDLHRDSIDKDLSTVVIGDKSYAKMMFLIGKDCENYLINEEHVRIMEKFLNENFPGIMRSTYYRNDTYNQDISTYLFSIEIGASSNTFDEVKNSLNAFSLAIKELMQKYE